MTEQIKHAYDTILEKLGSWLTGSIEMLPNLFVAILVVIFFFLIARLIDKFLHKFIPRIVKNEGIVQLITSLATIIIVSLGIFIALDVLNLDKALTSLLAGIGIVGLALGFAFRESASNFISGVYMAIKSPINIHDLVKYEEFYGRIKTIGLRATTMTTLQGQDVVIPNRLIVENIFVHYTTNGERRIDLKVGISYGDDLELVEKVTLSTIRKINYLLKNKPVDMYYTDFGESSINFTVRYWVKFKIESDYLKARSDGIKSIKKAFEENNITITFPIRTLDFGIKGGQTLKEMLSDKD